MKTHFHLSGATRHSSCGWTVALFSFCPSEFKLSFLPLWIRLAGNPGLNSNVFAGGNIPRIETKRWECWKFLDWRLNSNIDSLPFHTASSRAWLLQAPNSGQNLTSTGSEPFSCSFDLYRNFEIKVESLMETAIPVDVKFWPLRLLPAMEIEIATSMQKQVQCNVLWRRLWYRVSLYKDVSALRLKLPTIMKCGQNWKMKSQLGNALGEKNLSMSCSQLL